MPSPVLTNPNPITTAACAKYWVSSLSLGNPLFSATLRPYDGQYVIGNPSRAKRVVCDTSRDAAAKAVVDAIFAQVSRVAGKTADVALITMSDSDPALPVSLVAIFADRTSYRIADLFALAAADTAVAAAYAALITFLATK